MALECRLVDCLAYADSPNYCPHDLGTSAKKLHGSWVTQLDFRPFKSFGVNSMSLIGYACPQGLRVRNTQRSLRHQITRGHPLPAKDDEVMVSLRTRVLSFKKVVENR